MPSTNHLSSLPFSSTHNTATRYIFLAATIAAAVFSYSLVAKTNNNKRLTTLEMSTSTTSAASNTNATDMNGVPRVLHEIGDLMRHIFFEMRDLLYEGSVISVEIIDKDHKYRKISMKKQEGHIMCSPLILGSGGQEEWDNMEAVFAYMMCGHSVAWMWDVLKLLVRGKIVTFPQIPDRYYAAPCQTHRQYYLKARYLRLKSIKLLTGLPSSQVANGVSLRLSAMYADVHSRLVKSGSTTVVQIPELHSAHTYFG